MKREERRVKLARRQVMLAEVSQRAAMRSLADALSEEARSDTLARRSRELAAHYGGRAQGTDGAALAQNGRFAAALGSLAKNAQDALADASQQASWQVEALGKAQTRARRHSERLDTAMAAYRAAQDKRDTEPLLSASGQSPRRLARNMQGADHISGEAAATPGKSVNSKSNKPRTAS